MISGSKVGCQSDQIAAYLDGELDDCVRILLEGHIEECSHCRADLAEQQRLLCALDSAFLDGSKLPLPRNFAKAVATHAESDMSGMRNRREYGRALVLCAVLAIAAFGSLGAASGVVFGVTRRIVYQVSEVLTLAWSAFYDLVSGLAVISRVASRGLIPDSQFAGVLAFVVLVLAVLLLSRLIANYHRARPIE